MYAYRAINGDDSTGKLYPTQLSAEERAAGFHPFQSFEAAVKALQPYRGKEPIGLIDVGYVKRVAVPVSPPISTPETQPEPNP